jgi:Winged helix-turn helix
MLLFIDHIATKQLIAPALNTLVQLGWSPQRPTGRAIERDEQAIAQWKRKRRPEIKKKPKNKGLSSSSSTKAG